MTNEQMVDLYRKFSEQVIEKADEVDSTGEQDWYSLSLGWALAKGLSPREAHELSIWMRYVKHYCRLW